MALALAAVMAIPMGGANAFSQSVAENEMTVISTVENNTYAVSRLDTTLTFSLVDGEDQERAELNGRAMHLSAGAAQPINARPKYTTVITSKDENEVEVKTLITDADTAMEFSYEVGLPIGWTIEAVGEDDGQQSTATLLRNGEGMIMGSIHDLTAEDRGGNPVEATFRVEAGNLVVQLQPGNRALEYPVSTTFGVLPQYTFSDFFYSNSGFTYQAEGVRLNLFVNRAADGWYLSTISNIEQVVLDTSWYTVCLKFGMGLEFYNLQGMYEQYRCHLDFAWPLHENEWNLEQWRPCVGYANTVAAQCNP